MSTFTFSVFRHGAVAAAFAASGWIAFAGLAFVSALAPQHEAERAAAPRPEQALQPAPYAGPASPSFRDELPEPQPPTF